MVFSVKHPKRAKKFTCGKRVWGSGTNWGQTPSVSPRFPIPLLPLPLHQPHHLGWEQTQSWERSQLCQTNKCHGNWKIAGWGNLGLNERNSFGSRWMICLLDQWKYDGNRKIANWSIPRLNREKQYWAEMNDMPRSKQTNLICCETQRYINAYCVSTDISHECIVQPYNFKAFNLPFPLCWHFGNKWRTDIWKRYLLLGFRLYINNQKKGERTLLWNEN